MSEILVDLEPRLDDEMNSRAFGAEHLVDREVCSKYKGMGRRWGSDRVEGFECTTCNGTGNAPVKESLTAQTRATGHIVDANKMTGVEDEVRKVFDSILVHQWVPGPDSLMSLYDRVVSIIRRERERAEKAEAQVLTMQKSCSACPTGRMAAKIDRLKARIKELEKPRVMKPYSEECKPEKSGWYWCSRMGLDPAPFWYQKEYDAWYDSDMQQESSYPAPVFYLELEAPPVLPKGGAK